MHSLLVWPTQYDGEGTYTLSATGNWQRRVQIMKLNLNKNPTPAGTKRTLCRILSGAESCFLINNRKIMERAFKSLFSMSI